MKKIALLTYFFIFVFQLYAIPYTLYPVHAGHGNSRIGEVYCDKSKKDPTKLVIYVNDVNDVHNETNQPCGVNEVFGTVNPPDFVSNIGYGASGLRNFITTLIRLFYIFAAPVFLFMLVFAAWQYLTSGGDKEAVASARKRIIFAVLGLTLLALTYLFFRILGEILNFQFFV